MIGTTRVALLSLAGALYASHDGGVGRVMNATSMGLPASSISKYSHTRIAPPTNLVANSASSSAVSLAWTGDAAARVVVERKLLGAAWLVPTAANPATATMPTPSTLAIVSATIATDSKIDAFATYVYRVRTLATDNTLSAPSNELIVGPPPVGMSSIIAAPKAMQAHDPAQFSNQIRMTLDANSDPVLAYTTNDLNNDGENDDTDLSVITWNRAKYRWNAPVEIDTVGNVTRSGTRMPFSIARDASTGTFGVLHLIGDRELRLSVSSDNGQSWKHIRVDRVGAEEPAFSTPSLAMAAGAAHVAYAVVGVTVAYKSGPLADAPDKWKSAKVAVPQGTDIRSECVNIALDAQGKPVVTYCFTGDNYNTVASLWRPDANTSVKITDTNNKQNDDPGLNLTVSGSNIGVAMYAARDEKFFANHHIWFTRSTDNGATWSTPAIAEDDGANAMDAPVTVMLDKAGKAAMVANMGGGNDGAVKCGLPKLMRSADGAKWTTCAPDTKGAPANVDVAAPTGLFASNDKLYVAFKTRASAPGLPAGLNLWRER